MLEQTHLNPADGNKRKGPPHKGDEPTPKRRFEEQAEVEIESTTTSSTPPQPSEEQPSDGASPLAHHDPQNQATPSDQDRLHRFAALRARQSESRTQNRKEVSSEAHRQSIDPTLLSSLQRKRAIASQKLEKADAATAGEDFERKRAWDWTIEESEQWDRRMQKKEKHREDVAFQDYRQDARKVYKRQMKALKPDVEAYEKEKKEAIERAAQSGGLEVVETDDGELVAVDRDGVFYSTANSTDFVQNKPERAAVDRLVEDLRKAEEVRLRKRRERGRDNEEGDVTFINDRNKQFNQKLARFYNKYTTEIRDSFERGTAL